MSFRLVGTPYNPTNWWTTICMLGPMGTEYIRDGDPLPESILMYAGDIKILTLNAIYSKYTIGNTLDI